MSKILKIRLHNLFASSFLSFSANIISSSPDNSSSIVIEKNFEINFNESILGYPLPDSHLEIAARETYSFSASYSCVSPCLLLNCCNFSLNSILISSSVYI